MGTAFSAPEALRGAGARHLRFAPRELFGLSSRQLSGFSQQVSEGVTSSKLNF